MPQSPRRRVVLIVEDDPSVRELVRMHLETTGFETRWAADGAAAYDQCRIAAPDAMVLDINMPDLDGLRLLDRFRREARPLPPTMMLTARHSKDDVKAAIALGAKDYLTRPFERQALLARIARLLRKPPPPSRVGDSAFL